MDFKRYDVDAAASVRGRPGGVYLSLCRPERGVFTGINKYTPVFYGYFRVAIEADPLRMTLVNTPPTAQARAIVIEPAHYCQTATPILPSFLFPATDRNGPIIEDWRICKVVPPTQT